MKVLNKCLGEFLVMILKLVNDQNFKISLVSLNMLEIIIVLPSFKQDNFYKSLIQTMMGKLGDSKVAIRQQVSKIALSHFHLHKTLYWIDCTLKILSERNQQLKEEALNLIKGIYT